MALQGSSPNLQGSSLTLQGSSPTIQGSSIPIQGSGSKGILLTQPAPAAPKVTPQPAIDPQTQQINALLAQIAASQQKAYAPALDTASIYKKADTAAASNVNPYYTKLLSDFVGQQAQARSLQQQQTQTNVQNLQDTLKQTLDQNATTRERSAEDAATKEAQIATTADQRQSDQGTAFDTARTAEAVNLAKSGLTGSGLGTEQQLTSEQTHLTTEGRQAQADTEAKQATELSKARSFEDLATSNTNATSAEGKAETQANFDLNKFILGQSTDLSNEQQTLEQQRQGAVASERQKQISLAVNSFINSIANPAQRQAALQAYGSYL